MPEKTEKKEFHSKWENLYVFTGRKSDLTTMLSIAVINPMILYVFIGYVAGKQVSLRNAGQWYATMPAAQLERMLEADPVLQRDWDRTYGDRMQKLVFIGQHLDKEELARGLDACLVDECIIK